MIRTVPYSPLLPSSASYKREWVGEWASEWVMSEWVMSEWVMSGWVSGEKNQPVLGTALRS